MLMPRRVVKGLCGVGKDEPKLGLNNVCIEPHGEGGAIAVVTDRYKMLGYSWRPAPDVDYPSLPGGPIDGTLSAQLLVAQAGLEGVAGIHKPKWLTILENVLVGNQGGTVVAGSSDLETPVVTNANPTKDSFPIWRGVLPKEKGSGCATLHVAKVIDCLKRLQTMGGKEANVKITLPAKHSDPVLFTVEGKGEQGWALLMPVNDTDEPGKIKL